MNVAASSIAPAPPSATPAQPGVQSVSDASAPGSFANAMQSVQPKDTSQNNTMAALPNPATQSNTQTDAAQPALPKDLEQKSSTAPPKPTSAEGDIAAALPGVGAPATAPSTPAKPLAPIQFVAPKSAADPKVASDEETISGDAKDVLSSTDAQVCASGSAQPPKSPSVSTQSSSEMTASQPPKQQQAAAPTPATAMDASVESDNAAVADPLKDKQLDGKAFTAGTSKSAKKSLHVHEAGAEKANPPQALHVASTPAPLKTDAITAVAYVPQQISPDTDEAAAPDPATVIAGLPAVAAPSLLHAMPALAINGSDVAVKNGESAPAAQPIEAVPATTQSASPHAAIALQVAGAESSLADEHADASFAQNVFVGALAPSATVQQPGAVFVPSLTTPASPPNEHRASTDLSTTTSISVADSAPGVAVMQAAPVRHLEIAVNDPLLGNMDVRAEMRGGALHATLIGTQDSAAASMPALHQFLQQHDVVVHTLTYTTAGEGVVATGSTASSSSNMSRDNTDRNFGGGIGTGSQQTHDDGSQPQGQRYRTSDTGYDEHLFVPTYSPRAPGVSVSSNTLPTGSTLSIHI